MSRIARSTATSFFEWLPPITIIRLAAISVQDARELEISIVSCDLCLRIHRKALFHLFSMHPQQIVPVASHDDDNSELNLLTEKKQLPAWRPLDHGISGWRSGVVLSAAVSLTALLVNVTFTILAARRGTMDDHGICTLYEGECDLATKLSTGLHFAINVLSSSLLAASNYTMQCLGSPTRREVDVAHEKEEWLDIGVPVFRNLFRRRISRTRVIACILLAFSSFPIHLLYNSSVFKVSDANAYSVVLTNARFLFSDSYNTTTTPWLHGARNGSADLEHLDPDRSYVKEDLDALKSFFGQVGKIADIKAVDIMTSNFTYQAQFRQMGIEMLKWDYCRDVYQNAFMSGRGDVLLLTYDGYDPGAANANQSTVSSTIYYYEHTTGLITDRRLPYNWACDADLWDDEPCMDLASGGDWRVNGHEVSVCLSQVLPSGCKVQVSLHIMVAVLCCSVVKTAVILWACRRPKVPTFVTIGDAISNFLDTPDRYTKDRQLLSRAEVEPTHNTLTRLASLRRNHYNTGWLASSASMTRWVATLAACGLIIVASITFLVFGNGHAKRPGSVSLFAPGFGTVDPYALLTLTHDGKALKSYGGFLLLVLAANSPQVLLTFTYLLVNSLMTTMLLANEWAGYYLRKKPLRVSAPYGQQRSTYFLQLPLKYSIPLLASSAVLHWFMSQSVFLARLDVHEDDTGTSREGQIASLLGFSVIPLFFTIILAAALSIYIMWVGLSKLDTHMPIAGSCSMAISAACHPPAHDDSAGFRAVHWGMIKDVKDAEDVKHCSFTSQEVSPVTLRQQTDWDYSQYEARPVLRWHGMSQSK